MKKVFLFIVLILAFILLSQGINKPFYGHHEWNGVFYSNIARNYLRYGFLKTKFGEVSNYGVVSPKEFVFHTQHPVLFPILLAVFFKIFGIVEWSARLFAVFFSLGGLAVFYLILKRVYKVSHGFLGILLGIFTPLFLYYGRMPVYEPVITLFILLTIYFYFIWREKQTKKYFVLTNISLFLCQMIEWPGFYLAAILFFHYLIFPIKNDKLKVKKKDRFLGLWWLGIALVSFSIIIFHQFLLTNQIKGNLARIFLVRLTGGKGQPFTFLQFIKLELARTRSFFTSTLLFLVFCWLVNYLRRVFKKKKILASEHFVIFYLIFGLIHVIIFPQVAWYHDYMLYYFFPPVLLSASLVLKKIFTLKKLWHYFLFSLILFLVFWEKRQFLKDLKNLNPHVNCVKWGKEVKAGKREPTIMTDNEEEIKICPPFTSYYADYPVEFKLEGK